MEGEAGDFKVTLKTRPRYIIEDRCTGCTTCVEYCPAQYPDPFNQDISAWDVSNVTNMSHMFHGAKKSNQPLNSWDVSHVTNMAYMFISAEEFNQPLDNWDVSHVTDMANMFCIAHKFNQDLSRWDVGNVANMKEMFGGVL